MAMCQAKMKKREIQPYASSIQDWHSTDGIIHVGYGSLCHKPSTPALSEEP